LIDMSRPVLKRIAAPGFILLAAASVRAAPAASAEEAIAEQRAGVEATLGLDCERRRAEGEIIVCARRGPDPDRIPFPDRRAPGEPEPLLPGELPRAQTDYGTCLIACPHPVTITDRDVRKYGGRIVRHILGKDD
jgi:hypothetical protein